MAELIPSYPAYNPTTALTQTDAMVSPRLPEPDAALSETVASSSYRRRRAVPFAAGAAFMSTLALGAGIASAQTADHMETAARPILIQRSNGVFGDSPDFKMITIKAKTTRVLNGEYWREYRRSCLQTMSPAAWRALTHAFDGAGGIDNAALNYIPPPSVDFVGIFSHLQIVFSGVRKFNFAVPNCVRPAEEPTEVIHVNVNKNPAEEIAKDGWYTGCTKVKDPNWMALRAAMYPENSHLFKGRNTIKRWGGLFIYVTFDKPHLYFSEEARMVVPACGKFRLPVEKDPRYRTKDLRLVPVAASAGS